MEARECESLFAYPRPWRPVRYEADAEGRMYVEYTNGEIYPARTIMSRFAGRSDVTPEEFDAERAEAKAIRDRAKTSYS